MRVCVRCCLLWPTASGRAPPGRQGSADMLASSSAVRFKHLSLKCRYFMILCGVQAAHQKTRATSGGLLPEAPCQATISPCVFIRRSLGEIVDIYIYICVCVCV